MEEQRPRPRLSRAARLRLGLDLAILTGPAWLVVAFLWAVGIAR